MIRHAAPRRASVARTARSATSEAERLAERMAAFATASRLKLLYALVPGELRVEELAGAQRAVGQQPSRSSCGCCGICGSWSARRDGRRMLYRLHDHHLVDLLGAIRHQLEHAERGWSERPARRPRTTSHV